MIQAIIGYLAAFSLAWVPLVNQGLPWTLLLLLCPAVWVLGMAFGLPQLLTCGLYAAVGLAVWTALSGAFLPGLGAVLLALWAWDAAGLALWLARADEVPNRGKIWRGFTLRATSLGAVGAAVALGFTRLELKFPFWGLVGLLLAALGALAAFRRAIAHHWSQDGEGLAMIEVP